MKRAATDAPGWAFSVLVDGDDLVVANGRATCWGGFDDPQDDGQTASGLSTRHVPQPLGVALPILPNVLSTASSPLPLLPWGTVVLVSWKDGQFYAPLIDNGPARSSGNAIDLTVRAATLIDPDASATDFGAVVSYRVLGGAKFLPAK